MAPPRRSRRDPLEDQLNAISALRREPHGPEVVAKLRAGLTASHSLLVARAAKVAGEMAISELERELVAAFDRLMVDPFKLDKGCNGTRAIVEALLLLEVDAYSVFLRGIRHVQHEPAFGGTVDVAIELRANSASGLAGCYQAEIVAELVTLLVDQADAVRVAAARAIAAAARNDSEAVLRLKALTGDAEPEVVAECLTGLMRLSPERSFAFVDGFLAGRDLMLRQAAILAFGEARSARAAQRLIQLWPNEIDRNTRRVLLLAIATSRQEVAFDFLVDLVAEGDLGSAMQALDALAAFPQDAALKERVGQAIDASRHQRDLRSRREAD